MLASQAWGSPLGWTLCKLAKGVHADPVKGVWGATGPMAEARAAFEMVPLVSGKILAAAGYGAGGALSSCELYEADQGVWSMTGALHSARYEFTMAPLTTGRVLAAGAADCFHDDAPTLKPCC